MATQGRACEPTALWNEWRRLGQCHPNAANTHPETYPKLQKQLGKVAQLFEMVNWCLKNPLEGKPLAADDPKMTALISYVYSERRGVKLSPGMLVIAADLWDGHINIKYSERREPR